MEPIRILCFGDSNTWGHNPATGERFPRSVRWTGVMASRLGNGFEVIEEGQCGRTTVWDDPLEEDKNGLRYLPACLESHMPLDLVILMLGTNDLKARFSLTPLDISLGAERLVQVIQQSTCGPLGASPAVLLAAPPPIDPVGDFSEIFQGGAEKSALFASKFAAAADRRACAYLDVHQIIAVDPLDGVHYSAESHRQLGEAIAEIVLTRYFKAHPLG